MARTKNITIEGARIAFRNFSGREAKYNNAGNRNFCVFLDPELAAMLAQDGWNVRWLQPRDDQEQAQPYLQVTVRFDNIPPKVIMMSSGGTSVLDEEAIGILDWAEIETVDIILNGSDWAVSGKSGVKAYLKSMYIQIFEDELEKKWRNAPDSATDAVGGCGACEACDGSCGHGGV